MNSPSSTPSSRQLNGYVVHPNGGGHVHRTATVHPSAVVKEHALVSPYAFVGATAVIGTGAIIGTRAFVRPCATVADFAEVKPNGYVGDFERVTNRAAAWDDGRNLDGRMQTHAEHLTELGINRPGVNAPALPASNAETNVAP